MNLSMKPQDLQKQMSDDRNVLQNVLCIPIIELEQLNPRILGLNGVMVAKYRKTGGDIDTELKYEYEWVGGELTFIEDPFPRAHIGTGKVGYLADDERDPQGAQRKDDRVTIVPPIEVPPGAKSGARYGWNKEFLASHYGECYWKILDPQIEQEVQRRYYNILLSNMVDASPDKVLTPKMEEEAKKKVAEAAEKQAKGLKATPVTVTRVSSTPHFITRQNESNDNPEIQRILRENEELKKKLLDKEPKATPEKKKEPNGKKFKKGSPEYKKQQSEIQKKIWEKRRAAKAAAPVGNLGG